MRWKNTKNRNPQEGDIRRIKKFAFLPTKVNDYTVWLEMYGVTQEYKALATFDGTFVAAELHWVETSRRTLDYY